MAKVSTNLSIDADLKKAGQKLYADMGMDPSTAFTIFLKQSLRVNGMPFAVTRNLPAPALTHGQGAGATARNGITFDIFADEPHYIADDFDETPEGFKEYLRPPTCLTRR